GCTLHVPPLQVSGPLQNRPSSHGRLFAIESQVSVSSLHASLVHGLESSQRRAVPVQVPFEHASATVQNSPSSHAFVLFVNTQAACSSEHESVVQSLLSAHTRAVPVHVPPAQWSPVVQNLPSSHSPEFGAWTHLACCSSQESSVHALLSSQPR